MIVKYYNDKKEKYQSHALWFEEIESYGCDFKETLVNLKSDVSNQIDFLLNEIDNLKTLITEIDSGEVTIHEVNGYGDAVYENKLKDLL